MCQLDELSTTTNISPPGLLFLHQQDKRAPFFMRISREQLNQLTEIIEDSVEYFCDENILSGQTVWTVLECLSVAKQEELNA